MGIAALVPRKAAAGRSPVTTHPRADETGRSTQPPAAPPDETGGGSLWRQRDFLTLWAGQTVSLVGSEVTLLALPLTAVLLLGAGPVEMGLLRAAGLGPMLLLGLPVGVWLDRGARRPPLVAADLGRAALMAVVPLATLCGLLRMELLYLVSFLAGSLAVVSTVGQQAYLPSLVRRERLVVANAHLQASVAVACVAGPGLGGLLVQVVGAPLAVAGDAVSFLAGGVSLLAIRAREPAPAAAGAAVAGSKWREVWEGVRLLLGDPVLRAVTGCSATFGLAVGAQQSIYVLYAVRELGLGPSALGTVLALGSVGGVVGALLAGRAARFPVGRTLVAAAAANGLASFVPPLAGFLAGPWAAPALAVGQFLNSASFPVYFVHQTTLRQAATPERLRGRATASFGVVAWGAIPLGALLGGVLGSAAGLQPTLLVAAVGMLTAHQWLVHSPVRTLVTLPQS